MMRLVTLVYPICALFFISASCATIDRNAKDSAPRSIENPRARIQRVSKGQVGFASELGTFDRNDVFQRKGGKDIRDAMFSVQAVSRQRRFSRRSSREENPERSLETPEKLEKTEGPTVTVTDVMTTASGEESEAETILPADGVATNASEGPDMPLITPTDPNDTTPRKASYRDHPIIRADPAAVKPPIVVWYTTRSSKDRPWTVSSKGRYTLRGCRLNLIADDVRDTPAAKKLHNYDLLQFRSGGISNRDNFLEFETTRRSQICLVLQFKGFSLRSDTKLSMAGWKSVGPVLWDETSPKPKNMDLAASTVEPISKGYVFCRNLGPGIHKYGSSDLIDAPHAVRNYNLLFSELGGSAPALPELPSGWSGGPITQHEMCPPALHDMWTAGPHDPSDPDTAGKRWATWHPQVDYIYRCYYGHEHGTPAILAGLTERFDYTAWKNGRQDESHEGFKTYVLPASGNFVVLNLHSNTKDLGRVQKEHHTLVVSVTDKRTGSLRMEMSCKASSGGSAADFAKNQRPAGGLPVFPIGDAATQKLITDMYKVKRPRDRVMKKKRVNLYNPSSPDPRLRRNENSPERGIYEGWRMETNGGMCMNATNPRRAAGPEIDIKNAHNGCRDRACTRKTILGHTRTIDGKQSIKPNLGTNRQVLMRGISIGPQHCSHELPAPGADGFIKFYTNSYCTEKCEGPSADCIMQRIHKDFKGLTVDGHFEVSDVHGHNVYEDIGRSMGGERKKGLRGISQVEGALGINVDRT